MENPWVLLNRDFTWVLWRHLYDVVVEFGLRNSILAIRFDRLADDNEPTSELNLSYGRNWLSALYQGVITILTFPIFIFYPILMLSAFIKEVTRPASPALINSHPDEKWFFINGVVVDKGWLNENCKYLEKRFGRGVTGILNTSYGFIWDLVETALQRSFDIQTVSVRWATYNILPALRDKNYTTVRIIAHSQGAIIANLVLQKLYIELSRAGKQDDLKKLEVYTFANASREFLNPGNLVRRIEHYANRRDPIAKFGVLDQLNNGRFQGEIFVNSYRNQGKGHLFNAFYSLDKADYKPVKNDDAIPELLQLPGRVDNLPIQL
ncbi:11657_t:CDS:1 [Paraglomus brasilianum]|uniref:11657_t:CDS:1 n=1 Tax=Paraglomus brasilianum TaxID=144538 RepID=A0A9N9D9W2_9GLOM|nr:11657_t:CDS:1 [Paraglomus brasilianum]